MSAVNRSIAKNAISLINVPVVLNWITGLAALVPADGRRITQRQLQFEIIPAINALGSRTRCNKRSNRRTPNRRVNRANAAGQ
jgi:hypothetical protein